MNVSKKSFILCLGTVLSAGVLSAGGPKSRTKRGREELPFSLPDAFKGPRKDPVAPTPVVATPVVTVAPTAAVRLAMVDKNLLQLHAKGECLTQEFQDIDEGVEKAIEVVRGLGTKRMHIESQLQENARQRVELLHKRCELQAVCGLASRNNTSEQLGVLRTALLGNEPPVQSQESHWARIRRYVSSKLFTSSARSSGEPTKSALKQPTVPGSPVPPVTNTAKKVVVVPS